MDDIKTTQIVDVEGFEVNIPRYYQLSQPMESDPKGSKSYMIQTPYAECYLLIFVSGSENAMPLDQKEVIKDLRGFLNEKQGLIEVECGENYIYSAVRSVMDDRSLQYTITYQKYFGDKVVNIQGWFSDTGAAGVRENMIYRMCRVQNLVGTEEDPMKGWRKDPYDPEYTKGALMNMSEDEKYDREFRGFPLSMLRDLVKKIKEK